MKPTKRAYVKWTPEERQALVRFLDLTVSKEAKGIEAEHMRSAQNAVLKGGCDGPRGRLPRTDLQVQVWSELVAYRNTRAVLEKKVEMKPRSLAKSIKVEKSVDPVPTLPLLPVLSRETTIDIQIRSLVRKELQGFEATLVERVVERVGGLLVSFEKRIQSMVRESESRLLNYWEPQGLVDATEADGRVPTKSRTPRFLVADLRSDQHPLVMKALEKAGIRDRCEVVVVDQDHGLRGFKEDQFDKVFLLVKFTGHAKQEKLIQIFGRKKIEFVNGAALSVAKAVADELEALGAEEE